MCRGTNAHLKTNLPYNTINISVLNRKTNSNDKVKAGIRQVTDLNSNTYMISFNNTRQPDSEVHRIIRSIKVTTILILITRQPAVHTVQPVAAGTFPDRQTDRHGRRPPAADAVPLCKRHAEQTERQRPVRQTARLGSPRHTGGRTVTRYRPPVLPVRCPHCARGHAGWGCAAHQIAARAFVARVVWPPCMPGPPARCMILNMLAWA